MAEKFRGNIEDLKEALNRLGYSGSWQDKTASNNGWVFKGETGECLSWRPQKGTLVFQGKDSEVFKNRLMPVLDGCFASAHRPADLTSAPVSEAKPVSEAQNESAENKAIFIVHGHDEAAREQLELILMKLGLEAFILQNSETGGKTLIEALEAKIAHETALGIVLMTPDDFGYPKEKKEADRQPR